jgi:hypothetical protein
LLHHYLKIGFIDKPLLFILTFIIFVLIYNLFQDIASGDYMPYMTKELKQLKRNVGEMIINTRSLKEPQEHATRFANKNAFNSVKKQLESLSIRTKGKALKGQKPTHLVLIGDSWTPAINCRVMFGTSLDWEAAYRKEDVVAGLAHALGWAVIDDNGRPKITVSYEDSVRTNKAFHLIH